MTAPNPQINVRIDAKLRADFNTALARNHENQTHAILKMIEAYTASGVEKSVRHLDGSLCPLSELLRGLADKVRDMQP